MWGREELTNWDKLKDLIQDMEDEAGYDKDDLTAAERALEDRDKMILDLMQEISNLQDELNEAQTALQQFGELYAK